LEVLEGSRWLDIHFKYECVGGYILREQYWNWEIISYQKTREDEDPK
jgi:hypothetical protein